MRYFGLLVIVTLISIFMPTSTSYLTDSESSSSYFQAEEIEKSPSLSFYFADEENEVGFSIQDVKDFDRLDYEIVYDHNGGITEGIVGSIDNNSGDNTITREWFTLGSCSSGGVCVYHEVEGSIEITVKLYKGGFVKDTLTSSL